MKDVGLKDFDKRGVCEPPVQRTSPTGGHPLNRVRWRDIEREKLRSGEAARLANADATAPLWRHPPNLVKRRLDKADNLRDREAMRLSAAHATAWARWHPIDFMRWWLDEAHNLVGRKPAGKVLWDSRHSPDWHTQHWLREESLDRFRKRDSEPARKDKVDTRTHQRPRLGDEQLPDWDLLGEVNGEV
jgi:hypothetical protein